MGGVDIIHRISLTHRRVRTFGGEPATFGIFCLHLRRRPCVQDNIIRETETELIIFQLFAY